MLRISLAFAVLAATGCVGTLEPVDPGGDDGIGPDAGPASAARQMFDSEVAPLLSATCASCHTGPTGIAGDLSPNFMGPGGVADYYAAVVADVALIGNFVPTNATLLNKGAHDTARAWTTAEADTIAAWLLAEAAERQ